MMKKEIRHYEAPISVRSDEKEDSRRVEGYAMVFSSRSQDLGGFVEEIAPGALDGVLERSDVLALLNHDDSRGVLARSRQGKGSLTLEVDEKGLRYTFEAPRTALGEELLEGVRRGDICASSFAFTVEDEAWSKESDGRYVRTIKRFGELFDVSPVYHPAYPATSVDTRGLDIFKRSEDEQKEEPLEEEEKEEEEPETDSRTEDPEKEKEECSEETEEPKADADEDEDAEDEKEENNNNKRNFNTFKTMEKRKFSLLGAIRSAVEGRQFDEATLQVIEQGRRAADEAGVNTSGHILIPLEGRSEKRFEDTPSGILASQNTEAEGFGGEAVATELFDVLGPLTDRMVLAQAGARFINLTSNVELATYSGTEVTWESELGKAKQKDGKFSKIKLSPKRLTAKLPISKQWIIQSSARAEEIVRQDLIDRIALKLQQTILGSEAGTDTMPAGLFKGVSADSAAVTFKDMVEMEAELENANVLGDRKYILSPYAKAVLRSTPIDAGSGRMVMENNAVLGVDALSTGSVVKKGVILGDWSQLYIGAFGALDLTVDPYTLADTAQILLVVNAWFDYAAVRPEAFVKRILQ